MPEDYPSLTRMFGIELEFFLIDKEGKISNQADHIIQNLKGELAETEIKQEGGHSMVELTSFPHISSYEVFGKFFHDLETFLYEVEVNDLGVYYYGTYPGKSGNVMRSDTRYSAKEKILGKEEFQTAGKCIGFHYHYTLPRNTFNPNICFFYPDIKSRQKEKVVSLYNLYVALDPAILCLMQSSPYFEGRHLGKDSRVIVYRGDPQLEFAKSLYSRQPEFGVLNEYASDFDALTKEILDRSNHWKELLKEHNLTYADFAKKAPSLLDSSWKPVKISPHGTIESRGSDMNSLSRVLALSRVLRTISKFVQDKQVEVVPSEIGNNEPFKLEDGQLFVPEFKEVSSMQKTAAYSGFENKNMINYCKSLLDLVKEITPVEKQAPLRPFLKMIDDEKTTSDRIIDMVKKMQGYSDIIEEETSTQIAISESERIFKDLVITRKMAEKNLSFSF
jgi:hypothetical protein